MRVSVTDNILVIVIRQRIWRAKHSFAVEYFQQPTEIRTHPRQPRRTGGCSSHYSPLLPTSQSLRQMVSLLSMKCAFINKSPQDVQIPHTQYLNICAAHIIPTLVRSAILIRSMHKMKIEKQVDNVYLFEVWSRTQVYYERELTEILHGDIDISVI